MSLTTGRGPHGPNPAGRFHPPGPREPVYVEPLLRRVRAASDDGHTLLDSRRVLLVHRPGRPPTYAFPEADARALPGEPEPAALGYVQVPWDAAATWYEEEEQVIGHPRNPYHRIDCLRARRRLRVEIGSTALVDTTDVIALYETSRAPQLYAARGDVRMDLLVPSATVTHCPYKGYASHWTAVVGGTTVQDVAWSYDDPEPESAPIAGCLGFYTDRVRALQEVHDWFDVPPPVTEHEEGGHEEGEHEGEHEEGEHEEGEHEEGEQGSRIRG